MALSLKQKKFIDEYLVDLNATQAAIRAGYPERSARSVGHENLTKPDIQEAIQAAFHERANRTQVTADRVVRELARVGFSDPRKLFRADGTLKDVPELDDDTAATVAQIEVYEEFNGQGENRRQVGATRKIKSWDKVSALDKLCRHLGIYNDKMAVTGKDGEAIEHEHRLAPHQAAEVLAILREVGAFSPGTDEAGDTDPA